VELLSHLNKKKLSIIEEKFPEEGSAKNAKIFRTLAKGVLSGDA
jgi:hypothetical protein